MSAVGARTPTAQNGAGTTSSDPTRPPDPDPRRVPADEHDPRPTTGEYFTDDIDGLLEAGMAMPTTYAGPVRGEPGDDPPIVIPD